MITKMIERRTIRKYRQEEVPEDLVEELLRVAVRASNTGNMQLYSVIETRDEAEKARLQEAHFGQPMVTEAPVVLTFCADVNRFTQWAREGKAEAGFGNLQMFIAATIDTCLFAEAFAEAAEEKGLGLCYLGTTAYNAGEIGRILEVPQLVIPIVTLTLGYPAEPLPERSDRLPLEAVIHKGKYHDYTPEDIRKYYHEKESLEESRYFVELNHKETLAQVYTDLRYPKANNERYSALLIETLREQGFTIND